MARMRSRGSRILAGGTAAETLGFLARGILGDDLSDVETCARGQGELISCGAGS
jgi:hypothetical protein